MSVDNFKINGREWQPKGQPETVRVHDFQDQKKVKVSPHGSMTSRNEGWVRVGIEHDTARPGDLLTF
jgi:hypothetical protein